jgi:TatD DNase family protein
MLIDTHLHLDDARYDADREAVLERGFSAGVKIQVSIGTQMDDCRWITEFVQGREGLYATVGIHPEMVERWKDEDLPEFEELARKPKVVAIGEVGLDYHHGAYDKALQHKVFREMIRLSKRAGLPLVIHQRDAAEDTLAILREERAGDQGGVFHCFAGDLATAQGAMALGFDIAVGGILTFPNARELREVIRQVPLERLVLETDAPWLAPQPWRGKRNEPAFLAGVASALAALKGVPVAEIEEITTRNARRLFRI